MSPLEKLVSRKLSDVLSWLSELLERNSFDDPQSKGIGVNSDKRIGPVYLWHMACKKDMVHLLHGKMNI